ncbi:kunitz-type protease inhibitor 1b isoform X1 [Pygocentrus nattereri]|uniref:kunitz-type protease inhibitor 1b isoform X1 n=1 Tax=Pygocentrus nattereri TaxID=42514 RepID=UPI0008144224|nr:kunitz-type protease inhibitor 1b isoform X1 [Pygocentrus nattereri]
MAWAACCLCFSLLLVAGAETPEQSSDQFHKRSGDFVLITEVSVKEGAAYISSPAVHTARDCTRACGGTARCNLALVEGHEDSIASCFLFDCIYRNKFVCRFAKQPGFTPYIRDSVYERYLEGPARASDEEDRFPIANAGPDLVVQSGERVTLNGIESWDDQKIISYEWKQLRGDHSVKTETTDLPDQMILSNLQPGVYEYQLTVTDSAGQSDSTLITVLVLTAEQAERHCLTPKRVGPCRGSFPRWHYNAASNRCEEFQFGGCLANNNNYLSYQECSEACNGTTAGLSAVNAVGRKLKLLTEVCGVQCTDRQFSCSNSCCLEAELECDGQAQCTDGSDEENCQHLNKTLSHLLEIRVNEEKARCVDPPVTGPCRASMLHWYYDPLKTTCHQFTYGGCGGNKNNFEMKIICMEACGDITENDVFLKGLFERSEQEEHSSGSVATAVILAVVILALLALLGFCLLKKRKSRSQRQRVPTASPAVTFTEDTEHLVYKPTTTTS